MKIASVTVVRNVPISYLLLAQTYIKQAGYQTRYLIDLESHKRFSKYYRKLDFQYYLVPHKGPWNRGKALNASIPLLRHNGVEWVTFIDATCFPEPDQTSIIQQHVQPNTVLTAGFHMMKIEDFAHYDWWESAWNVEEDTHHWYGAICLPVELFMQNPFDEDYVVHGAEDTDLFFRLHDKGIKKNTVLRFLYTHHAEFEGRTAEEKREWNTKNHELMDQKLGLKVRN